MSEQSQAGFKPQFIEIDSESAGQRIDNFLFSRFKGVPKGHVYQILRTGQVRVNGGRAKALRRLMEGDVIRIPPLRFAEREALEIGESQLRLRLDNRILYEDDDFLVFNKPAGLAVHGGSGVSFGLIEGLRKLRPEARFLELVHRLDKDTSGCLLIAKKRSALNYLHEMFRSEQRMGKIYTALLAGVWARKQLLVDAPLKKNILQSGERMVRIAKDGKPAQTILTRLKKFSNATLVEAKLLTGRTHQIRVHAQSIGHAIAGDERYGDESINQAFRKQGLKRMFLHASELSFEHPKTNKPFKVVAPLDAELQDFLNRLSEPSS